MTYLPYGLTRIKQGSTWKPLRSLWYKNSAGTWTPVKTAWTKRSDGVWERIYPTPAGVNTVTTAPIAVEVYQNWYPAVKFIDFVNTGDRALTIANVVAYDGAKTSTTLTLSGMNGGVPYTMGVGGTGYLEAKIYGTVLGTSTGNITFVNDVGYFGSDGNVAYWPGNRTVIPITTTVLPGYSDITTNPGAGKEYIYYQGKSYSGLWNIELTNIGQGANLVVSSVTSGGYIGVDNFAGTIGFNPNSVSVPITLANLKAGTYQDQIVVNSNARDKNTYAVPVTLTVRAAHGEQTFLAPGLHSWTVPEGVLSINVWALGGGGGGGGNDAYAGHAGYTGHLIYGPLNVVPGDVLTFYVGGGGQGGYMSYSSPVGSGPGGQGGSTYDGGGGGNAGPIGRSGGGGGGGAATVILKNGSLVAVAAGGGGGGGGGRSSAGRGRSGYSSSGSTAGSAGQGHPWDGGGGGGGGGGYLGGSGGGLPGGDEGAYSGSDGADLVPGGWGQSGQSGDSGWYATGNQAPGFWNNFLSTYGIWIGGISDATTLSYSTTLNFPQSGSYTFNLSIDNLGDLTVDGVSMVTSGLDDREGWRSVSSESVYISAGSHTVTVTGTNDGGPGGIAAQIINPNGTELWNTLRALDTGTNYNGGATAASSSGGYIYFSW
jgi:hypothetical protein